MTKTTKTSKQNGEYRVRLFVDGEYQAGADYFTDDKQDATDTAARMIRDGGLSDKTTSFAKEEQADYDINNILYDVCNDYSLDPADDQGKKLVNYRAVNTHTHNGVKAVAYFCNKTDELHYLKGPKGLTSDFV